MDDRADAYKVRGPFVELTVARVRELIREPEAVFWVFVFPIVLAAILALAFRSRPPDALPVGIAAGPHAEARLAALSAAPELKASILPEADAHAALVRGSIVLLVSAGDPPSYAYDPAQPEGTHGAARRRCRAPAGRGTCRRVHRRHQGDSGAGRPLHRFPRARDCSA